MTSAGYLAEWAHGPDCVCSRMSLGCSLRTVGTLWPVSFTDWPASVMWDEFGLSALAMSAPAINELECSSLLGTPNAHERTHDPRRVDHGVQLANQIALLPTATAQDAAGSRGFRPDGSQYGSHGLTLSDVAMLLPTPRAGDGMNDDLDMAAARVERSGYRSTLEEAVSLLPTPTARLGDQRWAQAKRYTNPARSNNLDDAIAWTLGLSSEPLSDGSGSVDDAPLTLLTETDG